MHILKLKKKILESRGHKLLCCLHSVVNEKINFKNTKISYIFLTYVTGWYSVHYFESLCIARGVFDVKGHSAFDSGIISTILQHWYRTSTELRVDACARLALCDKMQFCSFYHWIAHSSTRYF